MRKQAINRKNAQVLIEYTFVVVCLIAALMAMSHYVKRAFQGNLRSSADQMGDQYEPKKASGGFTTTVNRRTLTEVRNNEPVSIGGREGYATITTEDIMEDKTERQGTETMGTFGATLWD
ncbi:MAG: hypothetical protein JW869_06145 [Candidatus Omnitrophica bacterium]|nr:hypothetical protein [Candidatus Omnitrophota bacterium]